MAKIHNDEFKREAVRIALTSGQPRRQVASDMGVGFSTLAKWIQRSRPADLPPTADIDLAKENERLRKENRLLTEERELLKKATTAFFRMPRSALSLGTSRRSRAISSCSGFIWPWPGKADTGSVAISRNHLRSTVWLRR